MRPSLVAASCSILASVVLVAAAAPPDEWREEARLFGQIQEFGSDFGSSVDLAGEVAIVGANRATIEGDVNRGAAYIFRRSGDSWVEEAMLTASDGDETDGFGWAVVIEGDMAVVSSPFDTNGVETFQGAAYVFEQSGGNWVEVQKLTSSDGDEQDHFGFSLALEEETLVVGARRGGPGTITGGAAYVFEFDGASWVEQQKIFDPKSGPGDAFGNSVDLDGDTIAVGDHSYASDAGNNAGAVYIFTKVGATWAQQQMLEASDAGSIDQFGSDVSLDRNTLIAGAEQKMIGANLRQGAAYVFTRSNDLWTEEQRLIASNGHQDSHLGTAVALAGGLALVGAELDTNGQNNQGVVYEYRLQDGVWEEIQWFKAPMGQGLDAFGEAIVLDGARVIIGNSNNIVVTPQGAAWVFLRPILFADGFESGDTSGWSVTVP